MEQIVQFASKVSTPIGVVSLIVVCCVFAFRSYLRNIETTLNSDASDEVKTEALNRLKIPTDRLSKKEQFRLAETKLQGQFGILKFSILTAGVLVIVAIVTTALTVAASDQSFVVDDECARNIDEARDLVRRPARELALDRLTTLYTECPDQRFTIATIAGEAAYHLGRDNNSVSWLERALENIGEGQSAINRWPSAYTNLGYAYERIDSFQDSLNAHQQARREMNPSSLAYAGSRTASGSMAYILWLDSRTDELQSQSVTDFEAAVSLAGNLGLAPQLGLACMAAHLGQRELFSAQIEKVVDGFEAYPVTSDLDIEFLDYVREYIFSQSTLRERTSFPRRCEPLTSFFEECDCFDELSERLSKNTNQ